MNRLFTIVVSGASIAVTGYGTLSGVLSHNLATGLAGLLGGVLGLGVLTVMAKLRDGRSVWSDRPAIEAWSRLEPEAAWALLTADLSASMTSVPAANGPSAANGVTAYPNSDLIRELASIRRLAEEDLAGAIVRAEALRAERSVSPSPAALLANLYERAARPEEALSLATTALRLALRGGMNPVAVRTFQEFRGQRHAFELDPALWQQLGGALGAAAHAEDAAYCHERARPISAAAA